VDIEEVEKHLNSLTLITGDVVEKMPKQKKLKPAKERDEIRKGAYQLKGTTTPAPVKSDKKENVN